MCDNIASLKLETKRKKVLYYERSERLAKNLPSRTFVAHYTGFDW